MSRSSIVCVVLLFGAVACGGGLTEDMPGGGGGPDDEFGGDGDGLAGAACADLVGTGSVSNQPVDIIITIDNSGSMDDEIAQVVDNISTNFADILTANAVDWRIILVSFHGQPGVELEEVDNAICVRAPLSGTTCSPVPPAPANTERFFHYSAPIDSTDSLSQLLATYDVADPNGRAPGGWSDWLRPDATRAFLEITDDRSDISPDAFQAALVGLTPARFGTAAAPTYVFHSIIGIVEKNPPSEAYGPDEPMQNRACSTASDPSPEYEQLSIRTGGLRFPVCQTASYDAVFQRIAQNVVAGSRLGCRFDAPAAPAGQVIDFSDVSMTFQPSGGGALQSVPQVASITDCAGDGFYVEGSAIVVCPDTCGTIEGDAAGRLEVSFACREPGPGID